MQFKNINSLGEVEVPDLRKVVGADEVIDVTDEQAQALVLQPTIWEPADKAAIALAKKLVDAPAPAEIAGEAAVTEGDN